ncbi:MAG: hypothetical protein HQL41_13230 [Alphaproteobacteria bacterium]|nr:hypothetical protein [Alphaproteobacteria bacterium]
MLELEDQIDLLGAEMEQFHAGAWFEPEMDQLLFLTEDRSFRAERVDALLTLLWHPAEDRLIGLKFKGFRWLYEFLAELGKVPSDGFLPLVAVLETAMTVGLCEAMREQLAKERREERRGKYDLARSIAGFEKVQVEELRRAA